MSIKFLLLGGGFGGGGGECRFYFYGREDFSELHCRLSRYSGELRFLSPLIFTEVSGHLWNLGGNFRERPPWVDSACADCPGFRVLSAAPAPASTFISEPQTVPLG